MAMSVFSASLGMTRLATDPDAKAGDTPKILEFQDMMSSGKEQSILELGIQTYAKGNFSAVIYGLDEIGTHADVSELVCE